jgi:hypothetical protein
VLEQQECLCLQVTEGAAPHLRGRVSTKNTTPSPDDTLTSTIGAGLGVTQSSRRILRAFAISHVVSEYMKVEATGHMAISVAKSSTQAAT